MACAIRWYDDPQALRCLPPLFRLLALYYRSSAQSAMGEPPAARYWHHKAARLIQRLGLRDTARVRLNGLRVDIDLLDARSTWVMDELLDPPPEARILQSLLGAGDTFLDIGANHGSYSLMAAPAVKEGRVLAFEPHPRLAELLRGSFAANRFRNAEVFDVACADRNGEATLYVPRTMSGIGGLYESFSGGNGRLRFNVPVRRLDDILAGQTLPGTVVMKLDVEGSEMAVLRGARELIRKHRPLILLELNPASARAAGYSVEDLLQFLRGCGYDHLAEPDEFPATTPLEAADTMRQRNVFVISAGTRRSTGLLRKSPQTVPS